ncbi:MAG: hypothetical protein JWO38_2273 [Gemmataceae bacterium]|nr:hypothetical protein [Gemmataceae bacterium]
MQFRWLCGAVFLLGMVMLNPDPSPGQPGGDWRGDGSPKRGMGGDRGGFRGFQPQGGSPDGKPVMPYGAPPGSGPFPPGATPGGPGGSPTDGPGGGRRPFDPERSWQMLTSMSGGSDTIKFDNIPPESKALIRRISESRGLPPLPETGEWTKAQYMEYASKAVAAQQAGASPMGGQAWPGRGGDPGDPNGNSGNGMNNSWGNGNGNWGNGGQGWSGPGGGGWNGPGGPGPGGPGGGEARRDGKKEEDKSFVAVRYGKLPAGLPDWFTDLDTDKDGQVGLYEWRAGGREMKEFVEMDLDGDGLIAPQEYLRYTGQKAEKDKLAAAAEDGSSGSPGGRPSFSGRGPGGPTAPGGGGRGSWGNGGRNSDGKPDGRGPGGRGPGGGR